ncbi:MAG: response regulator [Planctomycetota bacterium]|nr:response regulator [Planctomycetota bacterium]
MKILLIDDSKTMRNIQKAILTQLGHTDVLEASDGLDALSKVGAYQPNLILVDWNMPNMDGITFVKQYRAKGLKTAIIMVTTEAEKARIVEAITAGVNNYVVKPFTPDALSERIKETLSRVAAA